MLLFLRFSVKVPTLELPDLTPAIDEIGRAGLKEARKLVPVDSGDLRDDLMYSVARQAVVSTLDYAPAVEFGTLYAEAQPFFRPVAKRLRDWQPSLGLRTRIERDWSRG